MKYLQVRYTGRSGEDEFGSEVFLEYNKGKPESIIHKFFKDFWAKTDTEEKGSRYINSQGYPAVEIEGWTEIKPEHVKVLKKYVMFIGVK